MSVLRARWAAIGAAVVVTLGGGGFGVAKAVVEDGPKPIFIAITPCRLVDTRAGDFNVGPRSKPLGAGQKYRVQAAGGTNGECTTIPATALGLTMTLTMTDPTEDTYLTVYPSDADLPNASNLNALAGDAPVANLATTDLSPTGKFTIYNLDGTANVIVDVVGYYEDHNHDDRYLTETESDDRYLTEDDLIPGVAGPKGDTGPAGAAGSAYLTGNGAPGGGTGENGDVYFDVDARVLYGPKTGGDWGTGTSLAGGSLAGQSRSGNLPLVSAVVAVPIELDTEITNFGTGITFDTDDDGFVVAEAGVYRVSYTTTMTAGVLGTTFQVRVDGVGQGSPIAVASVGASISGTLLVDVGAGGVVDFAVGGLINVGLTGNVIVTIERVA